MLPDERVNDTERLTRTRRTQYNRATERIDDIDPSFVHLLFPVVYHRNVHRIIIADQCFRLLERFVLKVETVLTNLVVVILGNTVQSLMHQHGTHHRTYCIQKTVGRKSQPAEPETHAVEYKTKPYKCQTGQHRIDDHCPYIELQGLFSLCADTDNTDAYQFSHLASRYGIEYLEACQQVEYELRNPVVCHNKQVHDDFNNKKDIDAAPEVVVHLLLFPCFFKCHTL